MIRHIELIKIEEIQDGRMRQERLSDFAKSAEEVLSANESVREFQIETRSDSLDPISADLFVAIDFADSSDQLELDMDMDWVALKFKIAEGATSMLSYDLTM